MIFLLPTEKCAEIDGRYPLQNDKRQAHSGFNIGFELNYWQQWCKLLGRTVSTPVQQATDMMNSDADNFMKKHSKLKYTSGDVWIYLKAETKQDCEDLLQVSSSAGGCRIFATELGTSFLFGS